MKRYKKADFTVKGRRTGNRLAGRENEYIYEIFWNGRALDKRFTSKRSAEEWLGRFIKAANELIDKYEKKNTLI